jgi:DNA ligase-1
MDETNMMHGRDWAGQNLAGWWIAEKLHGCRTYWDGRTVWTRGGCVVDVPRHWRSALPKMALDGEIWAGYGNFKDALRATNYGRFSADTRFMVFDADIPGAFGQRYAEVQRAVSGLGFAAAVPHNVCGSTQDAFTAMQCFQRAGGEGVVARAAMNVYAPGRTWEILKLKRVPGMTNKRLGK